MPWYFLTLKDPRPWPDFSTHRPPNLIFLVCILGSGVEESSSANFEEHRGIFLLCLRRRWAGGKFQIFRNYSICSIKKEPATPGIMTWCTHFSSTKLTPNHCPQMQGICMNVFGLTALSITALISVHRLLRCTLPQVWVITLIAHWTLGYNVSCDRAIIFLVNLSCY